jgi:hypothetical protein
MTLARVGQLETVTRVADAGSPLPRRIDELAQDRLPVALDLSVSRALPTSREVVVLRRVDVDVVLDPSGSARRDEITDQWAEAAGASVAAIATRADDRDVVRFADEATFVAHFVRDLLVGRAWETWYYGAFAPLRDLAIGAAVARVLADHAHVLGAILRILGREGKLEHALATLRPEEAELVWVSALSHGPQPLDAAAALPIAATALRIASRLRVLREPTREPAALAASHERWAPQPLEWSSRAALADAVCGALAELARVGILMPLRPGVRERAALAVSDLDWLDRERLVAGIVSLLEADIRADPKKYDADTEALRRSVDAAVRESGLQLAGEPADNAVIQMRVLAALAELEPKLADHPGAAAEIQRVLAQAVHRAAHEPVSASRATVLTDQVRATDLAWHRCEAAGGLLLARALDDTRLAGLASKLGVPAPGLTSDPEGALLLSVELAVAGSAGVRPDGRLDPGLLALLAREDALSVTELATAWSSTSVSNHRTFRTELTKLAAGQRLDRPQPLPDLCHPAIPGLARGTTARAAHLVILAWSRWLPGLGNSTLAFLLEQLLRRGGSVRIADDSVRVVLDPRPLDVVLELAGYFEPLEGVRRPGGPTLLITREQT